MTKKFKRTIEDFKCENCGHLVVGDGYTNHCPECLWSKHVDNNPGDRENDCGGLMEPKEAFFQKDSWFVTQECQQCKERKNIKLKEDDNLLTVEEIIAKKFH